MACFQSVLCICYLIKWLHNKYIMIAMDNISQRNATHYPNDLLSVKVERKEKQIAVNLSNNDAQTKTYYNCILNVKLK